MNTDEPLRQMLDERRDLWRRLVGIESRIRRQPPDPRWRAMKGPVVSRRALTWSEALAAAKIPIRTGRIGKRG